MTAFEGSGALAIIGQNPIPQGTPDELRKQGVDPNMVGCCAPRSPGVRGCPVERDCIFHLAKYGGFKNEGPRYIGYYLRTHEGRQKEDTMLCHHFVRVLLSRMREGAMQRDRGIAAAERIVVIAQEPGLERVHPNGKPWPTTVRQRVGVPVNPNDHTINAAYKLETKVVDVPTWPRPGENDQSNYDVQLWESELERLREDPDFALATPAIEEDDAPFEIGAVDMTPAAGVVSEPAGKGGKK
jgi:hypothetical protein